MTHVSKKHLKKKDANALYEKTLGVIALLDAHTARTFFDQFLTDAEKIMLTKRLCAILMFHNQHSAYRVAETLHLSPSTAERMKLKYEVGAYTHITQLFKKKKHSKKDLLDLIELVLRAGLPPQGKGRWKYTLTKI